MTEALANAASYFINLFATGGANLWGYISGVIPLLLMFLTFMNALTLTIGESRLNKFGAVLAKFGIFRWTIVPLIFCVLTTSTGAFLLGKLLPDRRKPGYQDVCLTLLHPSAGLFPHIHAAEVWVYQGLAVGIAALGLDTGAFAIRALLSCLVIMVVRGFVTDRIVDIMLARNAKKAALAGRQAGETTAAE